MQRPHPHFCPLPHPSSCLSEDQCANILGNPVDMVPMIRSPKSDCQGDRPGWRLQSQGQVLLFPERSCAGGKAAGDARRSSLAMWRRAPGEGQEVCMSRSPPLHSYARQILWLSRSTGRVPHVAFGGSWKEQEWEQVGEELSHARYGQRPLVPGDGG